MDHFRRRRWRRDHPGSGFRRTSGVDISAYEIRWFNLSARRDVLAFQQFEAAWLDLLRRSYGEFSHADEVHLERVYGKSYELVLVLTGSPGRLQPVGCSYMRGDGRRGATAVAPEHRARGLGTAIVRETLVRYPHQVSEVRPDNVSQRRVLEKNGFCSVTDPAVVRRMLGGLWDEAASPPAIGADASYVRFSLAAAATRRYVMYESR
ncbi:GNAT family N-acetyltransferase [Streptomyces sp. NPDC054961]